MVDQMMINLAGKNALGKQELTILDMLQTNNFERPMYYAITVSPDQFVNLDGYFEQTGLAYQVVPKNANKAVNTDKMYDNVMNKFKWGGVDKPGVYIDEKRNAHVQELPHDAVQQVGRSIGERRQERQGFGSIGQMYAGVAAGKCPARLHGSFNR